MTTFRRTICVSVALFLGFLFLILGVLIVLYFKTLVDSYIASELPLRQNAEPTNLWLKPPVTPYLRVYFFNITNSKEFLETGEKLKLKEIGPYTYSEKWEKVNVTWHTNGTVSYRQKKQFYFEEELSIGKESDLFHLPNVPLISALGGMAHSSKLVKKAIATLLDILKLQPFIDRTVLEMMWGYDDPLLKLGKQVLPEGKKLPFDKFGFFYAKNFTTYEANQGLSEIFTVFTGQEHLSDFARINVYNGEEKLDFWGTKECNKINGTDGTGYPAMLNENSSLYIFNKDLCRSIHLKYKEPRKHFDLPAFRFVPTMSTFGDVETYPENQCYCKDGPCSKRGVFNVTVCQHGPVFISWPHFLHAEPSFVEAVEGLDPNPERHQFYIDIQPKLGIAMQAKARVQINIQMTKVPEIPQGANLSNVLVPVIWFEDGIDELPPKVTALLNQAINTPEIAESALSYVTFILGALLLLVGVMFIVRDSYSRKGQLMTNGIDTEQMKVKEVEKGSNGNANVKKNGTNHSMEMNDKMMVKNGNGGTKMDKTTNGTTESAMS